MSNNIGTAASFGRMAMNPTMLGGAGLGLGLAGSMLGGKGGKTNTFDPQFRGGVGSPFQVKLTTQGNWQPATAEMFGSNQQWRDNARNIYGGDGVTNLSQAAQRIGDGSFKSMSYNSRYNDYLRQNPAVAQQLAQALRSKPAAPAQYQAPNIQYQAPRG